MYTGIKRRNQNSRIREIKKICWGDWIIECHPQLLLASFFSVSIKIIINLYFNYQNRIFVLKILFFSVFNFWKGTGITINMHAAVTGAFLNIFFFNCQHFLRLWVCLIKFLSNAFLMSPSFFNCANEKLSNWELWTVGGD